MRTDQAGHQLIFAAVRRRETSVCASRGRRPLPRGNLPMTAGGCSDGLPVESRVKAMHLPCRSAAFHSCDSLYNDHPMSLRCREGAPSTTSQLDSCGAPKNASCLITSSAMVSGTSTPSAVRSLEMHYQFECCRETRRGSTGKCYKCRARTEREGSRRRHELSLAYWRPLPRDCRTAIVPSLGEQARAAGERRPRSFDLAVGSALAARAGDHIAKQLPGSAVELFQLHLFDRCKIVGAC